MTMNDVLNRIKRLSAKMAVRAIRWGRFSRRLLSLSLADDRVAFGRCLCIVLERGGIDVVHASRFLSRMSVRGVRHYPCEAGKWPTPENVASAAVIAASDLKAAHASIILVIPKAWAIVKTTEFPLSVKDNLSAVVSYELDRLTPLNADRAFYDFYPLGESETHLKIMLAAVNSDMLQPYLESLKEKGTRVGRVTTSSSAFGTLSRYVRQRGDTLFMIIHADGYEGGIVREGRWQLSLTGGFPSADEQEKRRIMAEQINPLVQMIKEGGGNPEILIGNAPAEKWCAGLRDIVSAPVRFIRETDLRIPLKENVNPQEVSYVALGGALEYLWPGASAMNLLAKGIHPVAKPPLLPSIVLLAVIAALGLFWMLFPLQLEERRLEAIDREIAARKDEVKKIEALTYEAGNVEKEIATISAFKTSRPMALILLKEMTRILPKNAWLSRVRIAESVIEIEGYAASATELLPKLEASGFFKKVDFASPTFRDTRMGADRFTIKMEIEGLPERMEYGKQK